MTSSGTSTQPTPILGILSVILAVAALLLVVHFALFGGIPYSLVVIRVAFITLLLLLGLGLLTGLVGVIQQEQPRWLSLSGLILTICIIVATVLFLSWLIG